MPDSVDRACSDGPRPPAAAGRRQARPACRWVTSRAAAWRQCARPARILAFRCKAAVGQRARANSLSYTLSMTRAMD